MNNSGYIADFQLDKAAAVIVRKVGRFVARRKAIASLYLLGLFFACFGAGFSVDQHTASTYGDKMNQVSILTANETASLVANLSIAERLYSEKKGWFSCDSTCMGYHKEVLMLRDDIVRLKAKRDSLLLEAKSNVGAWSSIGISELRKSFWDSWERGKEAARRLTMVDAIFISLSAFGASPQDARDDSFLYTVFQILLQFFFNLSVGLTTSLFIFLVEAWSIIASYGPSFLSSISLFLLVLVAASSIVVTAIGGLFGSLTAGVYLMIRSAEKRAGLHGSSSSRELHLD
jgi:hypothetical protein